MSPTAPDSIDLTYNTSNPAYTAAVGGFPLGDLNWFPDKYEEWKTYEGPKILWVSDGGPTDQPWVDLLARQGYDVQREDKTMQGSSLTDDQKARLNTADLVIISRGTDSGSYKALDWNSIEVPLIVCNGQITRSSRWQWFNSTGTTSLVPPPAKIQDPSHPIFAGVTIPADSAVALFDSTTGQSVMFMDDPNQNNGNLLAKVGTLQAIVEWTDTTQVYNDATTEKPAAVRMFFGTSSEFVMTADGVKVYLNAVEYMLTNPVTSSTAVELAQQELPNTFTLSQNYPNPFNPETVITYSISNAT
jgi:hypothetical protein